MKISLIVAVSKNGVIGKAGQIPWRLRSDLRLFKETTIGHHLIVGRKTWESIGRVLPGRKMIVLSSQLDYVAEGCDVVTSLDQGLNLARERGETEAFIAGGAALYDMSLPIADRIYLTEVWAEVDGDVFFPDWDPRLWDEVARAAYPAKVGDDYPFVWRRLERYIP